MYFSYPRLPLIRFQFLDSRLSTEVTLSYSQDFINRSAISTPNLSKDIGEMDLEFLDKSENPWSVVPTYAADLNSFEREHWQGRCCLSCGRLNSKYARFPFVVTSPLTFAKGGMEKMGLSYMSGIVEHVCLILLD